MTDERFGTYESACENVAQRFGVSHEIHPDDFIFQFLIDHPSFQPKEKAIEHYFNDGFNSAQKLLGILKDICGLKGERTIQLLDFASGYGCVTRHIRNVIPFCVPTASDIHGQAVQFIREKLQTEAVLSASRPEDLRLGREFDIVFALSFFSHMPKSTWFRWLGRLASSLRPEGHLLFTTHGMISRKYLFPNCRFDEEGFYFHPASEQKDIGTDDYGTTCTSPRYVFSQILRIPALIPTYFHEGYWWTHQDVFVVKNAAGSSATAKTA